MFQVPKSSNLVWSRARLQRIAELEGQIIAHIAAGRLSYSWSVEAPLISIRRLVDLGSRLARCGELER